MKTAVAYKTIGGLLLSVTLMSLFTPLTFTSLWVRNTWYVLTILAFLYLGAGVENRYLRYLISYSLLIFFSILYVLTLTNFTNRSVNKWQTVSITHRKGSKFVALQMLDIGALGYKRQTVIVTPLTRMFEWSRKIDTSKLNQSWSRTDEQFNPFSWK